MVGRNIQVGRVFHRTFRSECISWKEDMVGGALVQDAASLVEGLARCSWVQG